MRSKNSRLGDVVPWCQGIFIGDFMAAHGAEFTGFDQPKIKQQKKNRGKVSLKLNRKKKKKNVATKL